MDTNKSADGLSLVQFIKAANEDLSNVILANGVKTHIADLHTFICAIFAKVVFISDYKISAPAIADWKSECKRFYSTGHKVSAVKLWYDKTGQSLCQSIQAVKDLCE